MVLKRFYRLAAAAMLLLSGCSLGARPQSGTPTLAPTLDVASPPAETAVLPAQPEPTVTAPEAAQVQETPTPASSPTTTYTPWPNNTATPGPTPTPTRTATRTRIPTQTLAPTRTPTITYTPTLTFTPTPPAPLINLVRPGLLSKVLSPIQLEMYALSGGDRMVTIELVGEDGRIISRQVERNERANRRFWDVVELPFEIQAAAEMARLQVKAQDEFGRLQALASVDLILLAVGRNEINPPAIDQAPYIIREPAAEATISGGLLVIDALARPVNESPLLIELVTESNRVLSVKQMPVAAPSGPLSHTPFRVELPYKVSGPTPVRLVIRQEGSRIPGTVALFSRVILLTP